MAYHVGKDGIVKVGGTPTIVAEVREWEVSTSGEIVDNSSMNSVQSNGGWRTHNQTLKTWKGSLSCWWDETDTNGQETLDAGSTVALKLYPEGDTTGDVFFSGNATITEVTRKLTLEGNVEVTFSFEGNGALTQSTV